MLTETNVFRNELSLSLFSSVWLNLVQLCHMFRRLGLAVPFLVSDIIFHRGIRGVKLKTEESSYVIKDNKKSMSSINSICVATKNTFNVVILIALYIFNLKNRQNH